MVFFENKRCLQCKYLPLCMGGCPRDNYTKACKLENVDFHIGVHFKKWFRLKV